MVKFDLVAALAGGVVATVVMSAMMSMAASAGMTGMPAMPLISGAMVTGDRSAATRIGSVMHYLMLGTMVFGVTYGLLFAAFDNDSWWVGALIGLAHGLVVGVVFMPMMPMVHPRMSREVVGGPAERAAVAIDQRGDVQPAAPGVLGKNWGGMTPVGMLMGHVVHGLVLVLVYGLVA